MSTSEKIMLFQKSPAVTDGFHQAVQEASFLLSDELSCTEALAGQTYDPTRAEGNEIAIKSSNQRVITAESFSEDRSFIFKKVSLVPVSTLGSMSFAFIPKIGPTQFFIDAPRPIHVAKLWVEAKRNNSQVGASLISNQGMLLISIVTDINKRILACNGPSSQTEYQICKTQAGTFTYSASAKVWKCVPQPTPEPETS
jgi:hypothetical protein